MGPVRGGLTLTRFRRHLRLPLAGLLLALPVTAQADGVCETERPEWSPADGPMTGLDELFHIATTLPGLGIIGAFTLALLGGRSIYFAVAALFSGIVALGLWYESRIDPTGLHEAARSEGCVGDYTPTVWTLVALCLIALGTFLWFRLRYPPA
ncbi:hypothetical protein [Aquicoccus sp.]|uniref:hypothetical protein n=1 Tax=Aquicoccus sp. TaxID=2055851 RepID=UPI003562020A